jgi:hypothetical protein
MLEMLVTLLIIVLMLSIALPTLNRSLMKAELRGAAKDIQSQLHEARLEAMKTGTPYLFRYQPGTNIFEILPKDEFDRLQTPALQEATMVGPDAFGETPDETVDMFDPSVSGGASSGMPPLGEALAEGDSAVENTSDQTRTEQVLETRSGTAYRKSLPHDIRFALGEVAGETPADPQQERRQDYGAEMVSEQTVARERAGMAKKWSDPIVFFPNGRTSSARLVLVAPPPLDSYIDVTLRGLTGSARLGDLRPIPDPRDSYASSYGNIVGEGDMSAMGNAPWETSPTTGGPMGGYGDALSGGSGYGEAIDPYASGEGFSSTPSFGTMDSGTAYGGQMPEFLDAPSGESHGEAAAADPFLDRPPLGNNGFDTGTPAPEAPPETAAPVESDAFSEAGDPFAAPPELPSEAADEAPGNEMPGEETGDADDRSTDSRRNMLGIPREPW